MKASPPKKIIQFLRWFCREDYLDEIEGDLIELFEKRSEESVNRARRNFRWDVVKSLRPRNIKMLKLKNATMNQIQNYIKVYFRRMKLETTYYAVNILGLALGFSVLLYILLYVKDENKIDTYHSKIDRIYRVIETSKVPDEGIKQYTTTANPLAEALKKEFPEIEESAKFLYMGSMSMRYKDRIFQDRNYIYTTSGLFNILDFDLIKGDPFKAYNGPVGAVLSKSMARKLFVDEDPVGKTIEIPGKFEKPVEVLAVMEDMPVTSSYQFKMILVAKFDRFDYLRDYWSSWDSRAMTTLVLMEEHSKVGEILEKKADFMSKYYDQSIREQHDFSFQKFSEIHLNSSQFDQSNLGPLLAIPYSNHDYLQMVLAIGLFVILIATLNYINLSSVQALKRMQEAGVRKVNGATSGQLRMQLFTETFLSVVIAYVLTLVLVFVFFDQFLSISQKKIDFSVLVSSEMIFIQSFTILIIWILSSLIPSAYYSKLNQSISGIRKNVFVGKGDRMRKVFVVVQYGISLLLIIGSMVLYQQMDYIKNKNLGFNNQSIITWDINSDDARDNYESIIHALEQSHHILSATASSRVPGEWKSNIEVAMALEKDKVVGTASHYAVDESWMDTFVMEMKEGKNFSGMRASDTLKIILNETAVTTLGIDEPIGKSIYVLRRDDQVKMQIIGIVKDFHFQSMHEKMAPVILTSLYNPFIGSDYYSVKHDGQIADVIEHIEDVQGKFDPNTAAEINFLDEKWMRYYKADQARGTLILIATCISVLISAFGLFGLVSFAVERKTKEIGIRKALGATVIDIVQRLLKDYALLLMIALAIASPIAYWLLAGWLDGFAYRIHLSPAVFFISFLAVLVVSFLTVISRVYKLAKSNPVDSLRSE